MKRYLAALLALVLLLTSLTVIASADGNEYIDFDEKGAYLCSADGTRIVFTGWRQVTTSWEYEDGSVESWNYWVYGEGDYLAQGWKQIGSIWYYFWPAMARGTTEWIDGEYHLFDYDGAWTGLHVKEDAENQWIKKGNDWYYFGDDKYVDPETGEIDYYGENQFFVSAWYQIDGVMYVFDDDGKMCSGGWVQPYKKSGGKTWYYADKNGAVALKWKKIDGNWYYFGKYGAMAMDGLRWIDGKYYAFDKSGAMLANKWYSDTWTYDGVTYTDWMYMGADGEAKTGWFQYGGKWYYGGEYGWLWMDCPVYDKDGNEYWLGKDGDMLLGWQQVYGTDWSYFKDSGAMVKKDWVQYGGKWYYFDEDGLMVHDCTLNINGTEYKFDANGVCVL